MPEENAEKKTGIFQKVFGTEDSLEVQRVQLQQPEDSAEPGEPKKKNNYGRQVWEFFRPAVITCLIILIINQIFVLCAVVPTGSMIPLITPKAYIIANRCAYWGSNEPERGDVVVFETDQSTAKLLVKRVVAVGGDKLELKDGSVYLNGELLDESAYVDGATYAYTAGDTFEVPEGCVLVFGDNRIYSADARYWEDPYVPVSQIKGRVFFSFSFTSENKYVRSIRNPFKSEK